MAVSFLADMIQQCGLAEERFLIPKLRFSPLKFSFCIERGLLQRSERSPTRSKNISDLPSALRGNCTDTILDLLDNFWFFGAFRLHFVSLCLARLQFGLQPALVRWRRSFEGKFFLSYPSFLNREPYLYLAEILFSPLNLFQQPLFVPFAELESSVLGLFQRFSLRIPALFSLSQSGNRLSDLLLCFSNR